MYNFSKVLEEYKILMDTLTIGQKDAFKRIRKYRGHVINMAIENLIRSKISKISVPVIEFIKEERKTSVKTS